MPDEINEPQAQPEPTPEPQEQSQPTREEFEQLARAYMESQSNLMRAASYIEALNTQGEEEEEQYEEEGDETFDKDALQKLIAETVAESLQTQLQTHPTIASMTEQRGEQIANVRFDQIENEIGAFDRNLAITIAQAAHSKGAPAQQAVEIGARSAKQWQDNLRQQAVSEYEEQLKNRLNAPEDARVPGAATPNRPKARTYDEVNKDFFARRNAQQALN